MKEIITFHLNGEKKELKIDPSETLLWVIRNHFGLSGTKFGCGLGQCGSCTVLVDDKPLRSCMLTLGDINGKHVLTIEGLVKNGQLHPVQKAFIEHDALQCGFCTPGMIMNATGLLIQNPNPNHQQIIDGMEDNLCRCGAHPRILEAIKSAANEMKGGLK